MSDQAKLAEVLTKAMERVKKEKHGMKLREHEALWHQLHDLEAGLRHTVEMLPRLKD